ncbi:hypothetical protein F4820DRAFT_38871 [Hypoxylon rubiginosum]|uniref:Uncharacterized protein n=1 Tax=Hypoxylon rubiginosum TaxID=110542 RepID=A0ACB9YRX5_9PEZI|nr:hypothetical protein F4820DRAFT_38871 [Hypoxylon rubiginosum]
MRTFFLGEEDIQDPHKTILDAPGRERAASDPTFTNIINFERHSRPPSPPPRRSSWGFSQRRSHHKHPYPPKPSQPPLRRKLKWPSLRSRANPIPSQDPQESIAKYPDKVIMSSPAGPTTTTGGGGTSLAGLDRHRDRDTTTAKHSLPMPGLSGSANGPVGNLLKGPVDDSGKLKDAALLVGIKLDLEAEIHATARVRGDIVVGLY